MRDQRDPSKCKSIGRHYKHHIVYGGEAPEGAVETRGRGNFVYVNLSHKKSHKS